MKGHLHTDQLLHAILKKEGGLRTNRRLSHVFVMDVPGLDHLLFVTDAAINIVPDLDCKVSIVQNAIDLAISLGIETPKVGILSAVETVTPSIPSTIDAPSCRRWPTGARSPAGWSTARWRWTTPSIWAPRAPRG
jgi:phosphotransacetylase